MTYPTHIQTEIVREKSRSKEKNQDDKKSDGCGTYAELTQIYNVALPSEKH